MNGSELDFVKPPQFLATTYVALQRSDGPAAKNQLLSVLWPKTEAGVRCAKLTLVR